MNNINFREFDQPGVLLANEHGMFSDLVEQTAGAQLASQL